MPSKIATFFKKIKSNRNSVNLLKRSKTIDSGFEPVNLESFQNIQKDGIDSCSNKYSKPVEYLDNEVNYEEICHDVFYHSLDIEGSFTGVSEIEKDLTQKEHSPQIEVEPSIVEVFNQTAIKNVRQIGNVCQFCDQKCKSKAGLLAHQRQSKLCKIKQEESKFITKIDIKFRRNSEL